MYIFYYVTLILILGTGIHVTFIRIYLQLLVSGILVPYNKMTKIKLKHLYFT